MKLLLDRLLVKCKTLMVANGYHQEECINYFDTSSLVVKSQTIRVVLILAISFDWPIKELDANSVFLNGEFQKTIYMTQPKGFENLEHPT